MKKRWIVVIVILLVLIIGTIVILCLPARGNSIWATASPTHSALTFSICDGKKTWYGTLYEVEPAEEFLKELSLVGAKPAKDWSPDKAEYPLYGVAIGDGIDRTIYALWTNGYLLLDDGNIYRFPFDFAKMRDKYKWNPKVDTGNFFYLSNMRMLAQTEDGWNAKFMVPSRFESKEPEGVSMELVEVTENKIKVQFSNQGSETWSFGESYGINVLLDDVWYDVPTLPGKTLSIPAIAWILHAGKTQGMSYSLGVFGELPPGIYRLTAEGMNVVFGWKMEVVPTN